LNLKDGVLILIFPYGRILNVFSDRVSDIEANLGSVTLVAIFFAIGLSAAELSLQTSFSGQGFPATWLIIEGQTRPQLVWEPSPLLIYSSSFEASP